MSQEEQGLTRSLREHLSRAHGYPSTEMLRRAGLASLHDAAHRRMWRVGDRVQRRTNVYDERSPWKRGVVVEAPDSMFPSEECYCVKWDHEDRVEHGFFWHGLEPEAQKGSSTNE